MGQSYIRLGPEALKARSQVAHATRRHPERLPEARRDWRAARLHDFITALVDQAPPLTPDQLARLRALLTPTSAMDGESQ